MSVCTGLCIGQLNDGSDLFAVLCYFGLRSEWPGKNVLLWLGFLEHNKHNIKWRTTYLRTEKTVSSRARYNQKMSTRDGEFLVNYWMRWIIVEKKFQPNSNLPTVSALFVNKGRLGTSSIHQNIIKMQFTYLLKSSLDQNSVFVTVNGHYLLWCTASLFLTVTQRVGGFVFTLSKFSLEGKLIPTNNVLKLLSWP